MTDAQTQIIQRLDRILAASGGGGGTAWGAITGTLSNQTDLQTELDTKGGLPNNTAYDTAQWEADETGSATRKAIGDKIEAVVASIPAAPYLVYTALLTQASADAPVESVLGTPTIPGTLTWSRLNTGEYRLTSGDSVFINADKIGVIIGPYGGGSSTKNYLWDTDDSSRIRVRTFSNDGSTLEDGALLKTFVEVRLYP